MSTKSIAVPDTVYDRVQEATAAEGTIVEQLATKALERDIDVLRVDAERARVTAIVAVEDRDKRTRVEDVRHAVDNAC